jgi:hypothetical protein
MIKFILGWVLTALLVYFLGHYFPFWGMMIFVGGIAFVIGGNIGLSFLAHGLGFASSWLILIIQINKETNSGLSGRIAELMNLNNPLYLTIATVFLAFLLGGFSGMTGSALNKMVIQQSGKKRKKKY